MGRRIYSRSVKTGRNFDQGWKADDRYVRCSRCGFICHLDRDVSASDGSRIGWGINYADSYIGGWFDNGGWFVDGWFVNVYVDPVVDNGCPQCGTLLYNK